MSGGPAEERSQMSGGVDPTAEKAGPDEWLRPGAGKVTLRIRVSEELHRMWRGLESLHARSALPGPFIDFLLCSFWQSWMHWDGREVAYQHIYQRDRFECTSPVCTRRDVTPHHLLFRSRGGGDEAENVTGACSICHLDLIHRGKIQADPPADDILWQIGQPALLVVQGRTKLESKAHTHNVTPSEADPPRASLADDRARAVGGERAAV